MVRQSKFSGKLYFFLHAKESPLTLIVLEPGIGNLSKNQDDSVYNSLRANSLKKDLNPSNLLHPIYYK